MFYLLWSSRRLATESVAGCRPVSCPASVGEPLRVRKVSVLVRSGNSVGVFSLQLEHELGVVEQRQDVDRGRAELGDESVGEDGRHPAPGPDWVRRLLQQRRR